MAPPETAAKNNGLHRASQGDIVWKRKDIVCHGTPGAERGKRLLLRFVFYPSDVKREEKKAWRKKRACVLREREVGERRELLLLSSSSSYHETRATGAGVVCRSALACAELRHTARHDTPDGRG